MTRPFEEYSKAKVIEKGPVQAPKPEPPILPSKESPKATPPPMVWLDLPWYKKLLENWIMPTLVLLAIISIPIILFLWLAPKLEKGPMKKVEEVKQASIEVPIPETKVVKVEVPVEKIKWKTQWKTRWKTKVETRWKERVKEVPVYVESPRLLHKYRWCQSQLQRQNLD